MMLKLPKVIQAETSHKNKEEFKVVIFDSVYYICVI